MHVESSYKLLDKQRTRFASRMKRHRKTSAGLRRFVKSYESGKFSASNLGNTDDEDVGDPVDPADPADTADTAGPAVPTSSQDAEVCVRCGRGKSERILDALNIVVGSNILEWICCDSYDRWFHYICVGLNEAKDYSDVEWRCDDSST